MPFILPEGNPLPLLFLDKRQSRRKTNLEKIGEKRGEKQYLKRNLVKSHTVRPHGSDSLKALLSGLYYMVVITAHWVTVLF